jgi:hypothetical protein
VLSGNVQFGGRTTAALPFPFRASNLEGGLPSHALTIASLGTVRVLLGAYTGTRDQRFLDAALQETLAFDQVDAWRLVPRGLLWNDHALAARVPTLALLWSLVERNDLDASAALAVATGRPHWGEVGKTRALQQPDQPWNQCRTSAWQLTGRVSDAAPPSTSRLSVVRAS